MNIETKTVGGDTAEYEKFGWQHTEDKRVRVSRTHHLVHVLARDKDMPNYRLIAALDAKYFSLKSQKQTYYPMDPLWGIVAFLFFIFPFVIYASVKSSQKKKIAEHNADIQRQMDEILKEVSTLL
jgi:hypothetical protein